MSIFLPSEVVILKQNFNRLHDKFRKKCRKITKALRIKTYFQNMLLEGNSTFFFYYICSMILIKQSRNYLLYFYWFKNTLK